MSPHGRTLALPGARDIRADILDGEGTGMPNPKERLVSTWLVDETGRSHQLWFPGDCFLARADVEACDWGGVEMRIPDARDAATQPFLNTPPTIDRLAKPGDSSIFMDERLAGMGRPCFRVDGEWARFDAKFRDWLADRAVAVSIDATAVDALADAYHRLGAQRGNLLASLNSFTSRRLAERLESANFIPAFPDVARQLLDFKDDPNGNLRHLTDIVESDPSLAGQIFGWAKSAYYSESDVSTMEDAIGRVLGIDRVVNYAIALTLVNHFGHFPRDRYLKLHSFWRRALFVGNTCRELGRQHDQGNRSIRDHAYLAGLLHNFGEVVLATMFAEQMCVVDAHERLNPHIHPSLVQTATLGLACEQIGAWVSDYWGMGDDITSAIRYAFGAGQFADAKEITLDQIGNASLSLLADNGVIPFGPVSRVPGASLLVHPERPLARLRRVTDEIESSARAFQCAGR